MGGNLGLCTIVGKGNNDSIERRTPEAYLYKMAAVVRIKMAPPLKYLKLRLLIIN
jgi:hypothetical protein